MQLIVNYVIPVVLVLIGAQSGAAYGHRLMGSFLGLLAAVIYILLVMRGDIFMIRGSKAIKAGETKKGIKLYEKAIKNQTRTDYKIYACYVFLRYGYEDKCIAYLREAEKIKRLTPAQKAEIETTKGLYLRKTGDFNGAEEAFRQAHKLCPNSSTYSQLGFILLEEGKFDEAFSFNSEAMEYNNSDPSILDNMAMSHFQRGEIDQAAALYDKIMEKGTRLPVIYYNHALVLEKQGKLDEAKEQLDAALHYNFSHIAAVSKEEVEKKLDEITALKNKRDS